MFEIKSKLKILANGFDYEKYWSRREKLYDPGT